MLTGTALRSEATRLDIRGRSKMSADQLRAAIEAVTAPVPSPQVPLHTPPCPWCPPWDHTPQVRPVPFRARNGKHKPSAIRMRARYSRHAV